MEVYKVIVDRTRQLIQLLVVLPILLPISVNLAYAQVLSLGWEEWQPYQYKDSNETVTGLDIELVQAIAYNIDHELTLVELPWKRHLKNVEHGRTDLAASASKTPEREAFAFFSEPYRSESVVMYVRKADTEKYQFNSLREIIGTDFILAVTRGYYYGEEYEALKDDPEFTKHIREVNDNQFAQRLLLKNRVDGFLEDPVAATVELREEGLLNKVSVHMPIYSDDIYVMFSKKSTNPDLVTEFNRSLAELKANGVIDRIMDKYLN